MTQKNRSILSMDARILNPPELREVLSTLTRPVHFTDGMLSVDRHDWPQMHQEPSNEIQAYAEDLEKRLNKRWLHKREAGKCN